MAVRFLNSGNMVFVGKDKDVLTSFNSEQKDLLMEVINVIIDRYESNLVLASSRIDHVKFSGPATIIFWKDGTKTIVKCTEEDELNCETGIAMATLKKILGDGYVPYKKKVKEIVDEQCKKDLDKLTKEIAESIEKGRVNKDEDQS